jgi:RNA-directed DNA polymerase
MAKGSSKSAVRMLECQEATPVKTDDPQLMLLRAEDRVLKIQTKLHRWARQEPHRRFDDLFNLVTDPAFLLVAWARVRGNKGARTAGVDGATAPLIEAVRGTGEYLDEVRTALKDSSFRPLPVRERMIPKAGGKKRRLGIATITDRVVQASMNWCWSRSSRRISSRAVTGSAPDTRPMTRELRCAFSRPAHMSGW